MERRERNNGDITGVEKNVMARRWSGDVLDGEIWEQNPIYREGVVVRRQVRTCGMLIIFDSSSAYQISKSVISLPY
jgi:hypothetical protein